MARKFKTEINMQGNKIVDLAPGTNGTDAVNKDQLDALAAGGYQGAYNAATNAPDLTAADGSVKKGYMYTVNVAGTFLGEDVEQGDVIISELDDPSVAADFSIVNKNVTPLGNATETAPGIVELSTTAENTAGTDNTRAVTPKGLADYVAANAPTPADASETVKGIAEIATQAETDAGADDTRIVTPLKLTTFVDNANLTKKYEQTAVTLGDAAGNVTITHGLGTKAFSLTAHDSATGEEYEIEISSRTTTTAVIAGNGTAFDVDITIIG